MAILNLRSLSGGGRSSLSIFAALGRSEAEGVVSLFIPGPSQCNLVIFPGREYPSACDTRYGAALRLFHFSLELVFNKQENICGHLNFRGHYRETVTWQISIFIYLA